MRVEKLRVTVRDLVEGYVDNVDEGVLGYGGYLDIRPPYQREFVYQPKQRDAVMDTLMKGFPLGLIYWVEKNGKYEMLDGQQRTISICQYVNNDYSIDGKLFTNLQDGEKKQILDYELYVHSCEGEEREKLDWFETINTAGMVLTKQELRNINYVGEWLTDAKRYFSKNNCQASNIYSKYISGTPNRQDYLETVLKWISDDEITEYMSKHQNDSDAKELWRYFEDVMDWVEKIFPNYRAEMKKVQWGYLYNEFKDVDLPDYEYEVKRLMEDEDVTSKKGIYEYLLTGKESALSIRAFSQKIKRETYEKQDGKCVHCNTPFPIGAMEADHITPFVEGGKTIKDNCQMLCKSCNRTKGKK